MAPTLRLSVSPETIAGGDMVTFEFTIENFTLAEHGHDEEGHLALDADFELRSEVEPARDGDHGDEAQYAGPREGHVHVYVDDLMTNPILQTVELTPSVVLDAAPGQHEIIARLHGTDHRIIEPQITDSVTINVQ
jgi:hypothetical protein